MTKKNLSAKFYGWFDISNKLDNERSWTRKYIELDRTQRTLTFHSNECIRSPNDETKQAPIYDINSEMISLSSSSSSLSSFYISNNREHSNINIHRSNYILQSLSEYISPSLSKTILSSSINPDEKTLNNHSTESNNRSFTNSLSDRPSTITTTATTPTTRQSKIKFSYFFGRSSINNKPHHIENCLSSTNTNNSSLKRTKSVTKLERQKRHQQPSITTYNQSPHLNIPSNRSRSHESLFVSHGCGNGPLGSILPAKPAQIVLDNCHVHRLHPSIVQTSDLTDDHSSYQYIELQNSNNNNQNCYLRSKQCLTDNNLLLNHLRYTCLEKTIDGLRIDNSLDIWILEAKGLPTKKKYYVKICLDDVIYGKTTSKERRDILFWGENFIFKDLPEGCSTLCCKIYRENERRKQKQNNGHDIDLIGCIDIPLSTITGNQFIEQWYSLQISNGKEKSQKSQDGSINIRIKAKYQAIEILPMDSYLNLQEYIHRNYLQIIGILEPHISLRDKDEIATSLTRIAQSLSFCIPFLVDIIQAEIVSTSDNTLTFRGNSIATKSMEAYMKLIGETYLHETLTRFVTDIVSSKNSNDLDLEVDPDRVGNIQNLERNQITLRLLCEKIWSEIQQSHSSFPQELKLIFWKLRQLSSSNETMFNLISGSVFLRFLCPAILSPNLFGLTQEYPSEKASRKLTLIAKTLQTLANFSKFGSKESYMKFMNDFVTKESNNMHRFLANISTIDHSYIETQSINQDIKYDIDLGREYSILHTTLADLFEQLDLNIRQTLNELEYILTELTNIKNFYFSSKLNTQIHLHHHHHHIYHHLKPSLNDNRLSPYDSQISLSLNGTGTTNASSQGYHSISTSSTVTNIDNIHPPLSFTNPVYNKKDEQHIISDLSENDNEDDDDENQSDSSKALYFINNLCIESLKDSSTRQKLTHSPSLQQQQQQPLFVVNNSFTRNSTQNLTSNSSLKIDEESNNTLRRQKILSSQQLPPKMGVKALNHTPINKDSITCQRSPMLNLYQEEKCRRIECEKQAEGLRMELNRSNEQLKEYRHLINLINEKRFSRTNIDDLYHSDYFDDDSKPIERNFCLYKNPENKFTILYNKQPPLLSEDDDISISIHVGNEIEE